MMHDRALGLLGLGVRAGTVLVGTGAVRAELKRDRVQAVVIAADRTARTEAKVERLARARGVPIVEGPPAATLGHRVGRATVQAVGITDTRLAEGIMAKQTGRSAGGQRGD